jgi:nucleoside 2-deoxyribosyltransferase
MGNWRKELYGIPEVEFLEPFSGEDRRLIDFVSRDLKMIEDSDACVFGLFYKCYTGACVEIGYATALKKPIILLIGDIGRIDPMMLGCSSAFYSGISNEMIYKLRRVLNGEKV